ncbi:MAG: alanyl-tRNA editing protein [bacterium]
MSIPPLRATERLYYADSYLRVFDARVLSVRPHDRGHAVVVDRTAFFPTSGGQPHDLGALGNAGVIDVIDNEDTITHIVAQQIQGDVRGEIDWPRRFDHMQQHTGQHVLSQAALQALDAQTVSVHFGAEVCTLDLTLPDLSPEAAGRMEDLANTVVFEDRPVPVRMVDDAELDALGLRRPAKKRGQIRVVEVEGFDRSACGGTHVRRTGEIGLIKVRGWERYKGGVRVEFLCGRRALSDYRWKTALISHLAGSFTVKDREVGEAVGRLSGQLKERERMIVDLRERLLSAEARDYLDGAQGAPKIIAAVLDRPPDEAGALAGKIVGAEPSVVIFGATGGRILIARSPSLDLDAAALLRRVLEVRGGRGGGRPEFAQGAVAADVVRETVASARAEVRRMLDA